MQSVAKSQAAKWSPGQTTGRMAIGFAPLVAAIVLAALAKTWSPGGNPTWVSGTLASTVVWFLAVQIFLVFRFRGRLGDGWQTGLLIYAAVAWVAIGTLIEGRPNMPPWVMVGFVGLLAGAALIFRLAPTEGQETGAREPIGPWVRLGFANSPPSHNAQSSRGGAGPDSRELDSGRPPIGAYILLGAVLGTSGGLYLLKRGGRLDDGRTFVDPTFYLPFLILGVLAAALGFYKLGQFNRMRGLERASASLFAALALVSSLSLSFGVVPEGPPGVTVVHFQEAQEITQFHFNVTMKGDLAMLVPGAAQDWPTFVMPADEDSIVMHAYWNTSTGQSQVLDIGLVPATEAEGSGGYGGRGSAPGISYDGRVPLAGLQTRVVVSALNGSFVDQTVHIQVIAYRAVDVECTSTGDYEWTKMHGKCVSKGDDLT